MNIRSLILVLALMLVSGSQAYSVRGNFAPYTIMIYMNGSDLESKIGAATEDLIEILESGLCSENANVVILTGGANYWQNDVVPSGECVLWYAKDGELFEIKRLGLLNMGEPDTLADFITYAMRHFPAGKYGLVMWDHGGGAIAGFGHDEHFYKYDEGNLTLPEMDYAFRKAGLGGQKLEWLGFDSCLMATVEMAVISSRYAKYLVASEDLEPGDGWDYVFLAYLNQNPRASGYLLGREIVDTFMDFYGPDSDEILTLSVTDLNKVAPVMNNMGLLMEQCSVKLLSSPVYSFANLAKRRGLTKTFGEGSPRDNESDMVDIGDMAHHLTDLFPRETAALMASLNEAVLYNRYNSLTPLYGLSAYYVYGGPFYESLKLYAQLDVDEAYNQYLHKFFDKLTDGSISRRRSETLERELSLWRPVRSRPGYYQMQGISHNENNDLWPYINGRPVNMYKTACLQGRTHYAIPARVNGDDCDIIVCLSHSGEKILGYRLTEGYVKQKGFMQFEANDRVAFYYPLRNFKDSRAQECEWQLSREVMTGETLKFEWREAGGDSYRCILETDVCGHVRYGALIPV